MRIDRKILTRSAGGQNVCLTSMYFFLFIESIDSRTRVYGLGRGFDPVFYINLCLHNIGLIFNSTTRTIEFSVKLVNKAPLVKTKLAWVHDKLLIRNTILNYRCSRTYPDVSSNLLIVIIIVCTE